MEGQFNKQSSASAQAVIEPLQKRLTVRTMAKDIARLREMEVKEEREKIMKLKPEEVAKVEMKKAEEERKRKEKEAMLAKKKEEEELKKRTEAEKKRTEAEKKRIDEERKRAEEERRRAEEMQKRVGVEQRKKDEEIRKKLEEEKLRMAKEALILAKKKEEKEQRKRLEEEKLKREITLKETEEQKKKQEIELALAKKREEALRIAEEEKRKAEEKRIQEERKIMEEGTRRARLKELLDKVKTPIEKFKAREEKPEVREEILKKGFFIRMPSKKEVELREAVQPETTPEELLIQKLKQVEIRRERERKEREEFLKRVDEGKIEVKPPLSKEEVIERYPLIAKVPTKKSPLFEKVFVRVIVVGFLVASWAAIITFWYWFLVARKPVIVTPSPQTQTTEKPQVIIPASLIPVLKTQAINYTSPEELRLSLFQLLNDEYPAGQFQRIVIKTETKVLSLQEFFSAMGIEAPLSLYQKLDTDFTLFLYPIQKYNRLGFLTKIKERENISTSLKNWEPTMEEDFENLFTLLGKSKSALIPYFRGAQYAGTTFRFQTFALNDLGICYTVFGDYFVWSSSWDSITKAIDLLK